MPHKPVEIRLSHGRMPEHLGFYEVGSQFSLRWFFQHALAWKGHVPQRKYRLI
jgi:hypothetical protein